MTIVAFLGLGVMGGPMAGHLAKAGHDVRVWNRTGDKALAWAQAWSRDYSAQAAGCIDDAVVDADAVMICVGNDDDVRAVCGPALAGMSAGAVLVDHTTASAGLARELETDCGARGVLFVDAPVSGGEAGAVNGQLTVMCGGTQEAFAKAQPLMGAYAKAVTHMGAAGAGQLTKMVNQICIAGVVQGLSEAVHFADCAGLDVDRVFEAIGQGAAQSWQMDHRAGTMAQDEFEFGFAVDWMRKDLGMALDAGRAVGAQLPLTALVDQFYADVQAMGGGRWDTSSLVRRLKRGR